MLKSANNEIASKIIAFLREMGGDEAEMGISNASTKFDCDPPTICRTLKRLRNAGIIKVTAGLAHQRPNRYTLNEEFREGNSWREALKRKSSDGKAETGPNVPAEACHSEECLGARKVLLEELLGTFERLKVLQEENQALSSAAKRLQKEVGDLRSEAEKKGNACHQLRNDVNQLESRLRALRIQTSQPPTTAGAAVKELKFDGFGAVILSGEGLPDRT